jgi:hypothetical protein
MFLVVRLPLVRVRATANTLANLFAAPVQKKAGVKKLWRENEDTVHEKMMRGHLKKLSRPNMQEST